MNEPTVKWLALDNADATASGKQHAFIHKVCKAPYTREKYDGNISLCGRSCAINEDELRISFVDLDSEPLDESDACKICLRKVINFIQQ